jgi:hypothetical protein
MVSSASYLQVQGYSSSTAIRVIRNTPTSEWSGGIYTDNYWINAFQTHKISGYFRAPENIDGRVFVGDTNKPNNISSDNYSWQYSQRLHNTTPLSWSYFEYEFNPVPNIYYDNFGCAMNIYLYPGISGESNPTDWVEYDNIKIERLNEINNNQTGQGSPSYQPSPVLLTPANNAEFEIFRDVLLTWEPVSNTNYYILQISTNELFNDAQEYQVVLANMDLSFDEYGTHYWRVKSVSTGGVDGYWSDNRTFIITP